MSQPIVQPLVPDPVDVVGDLHGEIDALNDLLGQLGYRKDGTHPDGRHLVFLGDLTDRGPDSLAVMKFVQGLGDAEIATLYERSSEQGIHPARCTGT